MKKVFYHVVTERPMKLNQIIVFDENHHSALYEIVNRLKGMAEQVYAKGITDLSSEVKKVLRELALEEVRREYFPSYPSRLSCLYVSSSLPEAEFWYNLFISEGRKTYQIVKVEVDGPIFSADAWNCFDGTNDKMKNRELAKKYWLNEKNSVNKKPLVEILASGNIKVVEIIKDLEIQNNPSTREATIK